jgi:hypothetical protein
MNRVQVVAAFGFALMSVGAASERAEAQSQVGPEVISAAQAAAGTAKVLGAHVYAADSVVVVVVEDAQFNSGWSALEGPLRLGGREETPRATGRAIAEAIRSGLPAELPVKLIEVYVVGTTPAPGEEAGRSYRERDVAMRLPYSFADPAPR